VAPTVAVVAALAGESPRAAADELDASVTPAPVAAATSAQRVSSSSPLAAHSATRRPFDEPAERLVLGAVIVGTAAHWLLLRRDALPAGM